MRIAVLPRATAAHIIAGSISRAGWVVSAASLALTVPLLLDVLLARGRADAIPIPLAVLLTMFTIASVAAVRPRWWIAATFLLVGVPGAVAYELFLLAAEPGIAELGPFLLNRPAVSLVLVGVAARTWRGGLVWTTVGFAASMVASLVVAALATVRVSAGWGPILVFVVFATAYLLAGNQSRQRRPVPQLERFETETRQASRAETARARVGAAVHDTLLNDLSFVVNAPNRLDDRSIARLRSDLATLSDSQLRFDDAPGSAEGAGVLHERIVLLSRDPRWRDLSIRVVESGAGPYLVEPDAALALIDAIGACLENVLRHAGTDSAEINLAAGDGAVTAIVSDPGVGFDPAVVGADRLGLRNSVMVRVQLVGGTVRIWSAPGAGTSIVLRVPAREPNGGDHGHP